jgi:hypothetical protein
MAKAVGIDVGLTPAGEIEPSAGELVMAELRGHFRPEFLNRVDEIVVETQIGRALLGGNIPDGTRLRIDADGGKIVVAANPTPEARKAA